MTEPTPDRLPRMFEDEANRKLIIAFFKGGMSISDVVFLINDGKAEASLRREWELDPEFHRACMAAMEDPFESTLRKAIELAQYADVAGENEGAHKALAHVMRHYDRLLDRRLKAQLSIRALQSLPASGQGPRSSLVLGPEGVRELINHLAGEDRKTKAIETTTTEET